ncbi:MAG: hypothetical protein CFE26_07850 [Verrucomicrobiales bacterium VVV1]|nr:MAG: hypothetical protein CFE26_07850 [Verrucomicrobiales bacterium VVV1]
MLLAGVAVAAFAMAGISVFPCPFFGLTGKPCPGCGLTRASLAMLRGDWRAMLHFHPFGPVLAVFCGIVALGLILPEPLRGKWRMWIDRFEGVTRWPAWVGVAMLLYSLTRWFAIC